MTSSAPSGIAEVSPSRAVPSAFDAPVVCPSLTPRDRELDALGKAAARVAEGFGQVVLVSGEPGIGKSRLVHEFC